MKDPKQLGRYRGLLAFIDQLRRQVFDAEPNGEQTGPRGNGQEIAVLVSVELGRLCGDADLCAEPAATSRRRSECRQHLLRSRAPIEEVVVGTEEVLDAIALIHAPQLVDRGIGGAEPPRPLVQCRYGAVRAVEFTSLREQNAGDGCVRADSGIFQWCRPQA